MSAPRTSRSRALAALALLGHTLLAAPIQARDLEVILLQGAAGAPEYAEIFQKQTATWQQAAAKAGAALTLIGQAADDTTPDLDRLEAALAKAAPVPGGQLWLVLIGHGTHDGREARFNLRGPDLSPARLAQWLAPLQRELVLIHTGSASGAFLKPLTGPRRTLVTATKGGDEVFYARFGEHFAPAIAGLPEADLDQDRQVSVLEAFLHASKKVAEFYQNEDRLATEHALIEDNGDGIGTRFEVFEGTRPSSAPDGARPDGARAAQLVLLLSDEEARLTDAQRAARDTLEHQLQAHKDQRPTLSDDAYFTGLEKLLRALAEIYR